MPEEHINESTVAHQAPVKTGTVKSSLGVPIAIVISAALIACAIYFKDAGRGASVDVQAGINAAQNGGQPTATPEVAPITKDDHIRGNPDAPIVIIEYSDYDCPFCRLFHDTMVKIMDDFGKDGKVAWVYRQFPINGLHPNASKISEASECVAELGGNNAFWKFNDALNGSRKISYDANGQISGIEPTDMKRVSEFAVTAGVDKGKFELCYNSGKYADKINADITAGAKAGVQGTPHSIIVVGGNQGVINGAQPYETVKAMVQNIIDQMNGQNS